MKDGPYDEVPLRGVGGPLRLIPESVLNIGQDDPHPFIGDKGHPCQRCGGGFYESSGHWRKA